MLHIKVTIGSEIYYLAEQDGELYDGPTLRFWKGKILDLSPQQMLPEFVYGGFVRLGGNGEVSFSPDAFSWPISRTIELDVRSSDDYGKVSNLYTATAYFRRVTKEELVYSVYQPEFASEVYLLDDAPDLGSETNRVYPLAFGAVSMKKALQINTSYHYHKAGITGTDPSISGGDYDIHVGGVQRDKWVSGEYGDIVDASDYFKVVLFSDGTTPKEPIGGEVFISGTNNNSFLHNSTTYYMDKLDGLFAYCINRINAALGTSYVLDATYARGTVPTLSCYIDRQENIIDFMSKVAAYFTHCFYIDEEDSKIYLVDMFTNNGTLSLSNEDGSVPRFFDAEYENPDPSKNLTAKWESIEADIGPDGFPFIYEIQHEQKIEFSSQVGREITFDGSKMFQSGLSDISSELINIGKLIQTPTGTIHVPYDTNVKPGQSINYVDTGMYHDSTVKMRARELVYDPVRKVDLKVIGQVY